MKNQELIFWMEDYLHKNIPITKEMGIQIALYQKDNIILKSPIEFNKNDKNTAFAGSQFSLAVLSGWCFITMKLKEEEIENELVVYQAEIKYHLPIVSDLKANTGFIGKNDWEEFLENLKKKGKSKISLKIELIENNQIKTDFKAIYFAKLKKRDL